MRPTTLPLFSLVSLTLSTFSLTLSLAAPLPTNVLLLTPRDLPPAPDPVTAALASKLAAIDRELGRRPVLPGPTPAPISGDEGDEGEEGGSMTTTTSSAGRKKVGNPKKVKNPKARPTTTTTPPPAALIRRSPSPSANPPPPPAPSNPKHPSSPAPPGNPKHIYHYPPSLPTGKWVVVRPSGEGEGASTVTLVGISPTHPGEPGRGRETGRA